MSDMKCPFCQQELSYMDTIDGGFEIFSCDCASGIWLFGNDKMWQELIRTKKQLEMANAELDYIKEQIEKNSVFDNTRKALDVAVDALKYANKCIKGGCVNWETEIDKALEQITALEQKDVK